MPGAELVEIIDDKTFKGKVSVRLGPVALTFICLATFEEIDNDARTARVQSQGADAKGRGNANATILFSVEEAPTGSRATIVTDLNLTGSVAQYGRGAGMIQTVANQIVAQFAKNLEAQVKQIEQAQASHVVAFTADGGAALAPAAMSVPPSAAVPVARAPVAKPISGFALIWSVLWQKFAGWFRNTNGK